MDLLTSMTIFCAKHLGVLVPLLHLNTACNSLGHLNLYYFMVHESYYCIRQQWVFHRKVCKHYNTGRHRLMPPGKHNQDLVPVSSLSGSLVHFLATCTDQPWCRVVHRCLVSFFSFRKLKRSGLQKQFWKPSSLVFDGKNACILLIFLCLEDFLFSKCSCYLVTCRNPVYVSQVF